MSQNGISVSCNERASLKFVAYMQVIGIILVVVGHSLHEYPDGANGCLTLAYRMIYSFHMPLFIFVSGFLLYFTTFARGVTKPWRHFAWGKFMRLMLPYLTLSLVTFVPRTRLSGMADDAIPLSLDSLGRSLLYSDHLVIPYFWYLQVCFLLLIATYGILLIGHRLRTPHTPLLITLILVYATMRWWPVRFTSFWGMDMLPNMALFFALGIGYAAWHAPVDRIVSWSNPLTLCLAVLLWGALFFLTEGTDLFILCALAGIAACTSLSRIIEKREWRMLDHLTGANYIIFLLSWYCNVAAQQVLHHYTDLPWWVYSLLSIFAGLYIPWLFYRLLQRHRSRPLARTIALLLGQRLRK